MKKFNQISNITVISLTLLCTAILTGCKNKATGPEEEEHHLPIGAVLKMNGEETVRYENATTSDSIHVAAGDETALISIFFLSEDGDEFQPDEPASSLEWVIEDSTIAEVEQHAEDGKWSFHVHGLSSGSTTVTFDLMHENHSDFTVADIPIIVE